MSTLQDNFKVLLQILNGKINKKVEQKDIDEANNKIKKSVDTAVRGLRTFVNAQLDYYDEVFQRKADKEQIKTINNRSLIHDYNDFYDDTNIVVHFPKTNPVNTSGLFTHSSSWSGGLKMDCYKPVTLTQEELNTHIQYLKDNPNEVSPYYMSWYDLKHGIEDNVPYGSGGPQSTIDFDIKADINDLVVVKISCEATRNSSGANNNLTYQEVQDVINNTINVSSGWIKLDDATKTFGAEYLNEYKAVRQIIYYKFADKAKENIHVDIGQVSIGGVDKYPRVRIFYKSISNVSSFEYLNQWGYKDKYYTPYHTNNTEVDKGILPIPTLGNNDFALFCTSNCLGEYGGSGYTNTNNNFVGPELTYRQYGTHGLIVTDINAGYKTVSPSIYNGGYVTNPDYAIMTCFILHSPKIESETLYEKYGCIYQLTQYTQVHSNYSADGSLSVADHLFFEKVPIKYNDSELVNTQVLSDKVDKRINLTVKADVASAIAGTDPFYATPTMIRVGNYNTVSGLTEAMYAADIYCAYGTTNVTDLMFPFGLAISYFDNTGGYYAGSNNCSLQYINLGTHIFHNDTDQATQSALHYHGENAPISNNDMTAGGFQIDLYVSQTNLDVIFTPISTT